jgi:protein ImuA
MIGGMSSSHLSALRESIRRIERPIPTAGVLPFGIDAIDRALPGGGLARGAVHEILGAGGDEEDGALAAGFAAGILGRLVAAGGSVLWCLQHADLYGPGLAACGLDPGYLVLVRAMRDSDILWAMEEGLRASGIAAVVGEVGALPPVTSRRLQLAAERSGITAFLLRRWRNAGEAAHERHPANAAVTRWRISILPSASAGGEPGVGRPCWRVELLRCRGGGSGSWEMPVTQGKVTDAADPLSVAEAMAHRPIATGYAAPGENTWEKTRSTG